MLKVETHNFYDCLHFGNLDIKFETISEVFHFRFDYDFRRWSISPDNSSDALLEYSRLLNIPAARFWDTIEPLLFSLI